MGSILRKPISLILFLILFLFSSTIVSYGASAQYVYDSLNRLIQIRYGDGTAVTYSYDQSGNRITEVVGNVTPPSGSIIINSGTGHTNNPNVTLTLSCTDQFGCYQMQFSNDNINWSTPEALNTTKAWILAGGDGTKTVYVRYSDPYGFWSDAFSITIVLNPRVRIAGGPYYSTIQAAYDAVPDGGIIQCRAITFIESLTVNRNINVTLAGGYDSGFTTNSGSQTTVQGMVTTTPGGGTITISNFILQ